MLKHHQWAWHLVLMTLHNEDVFVWPYCSMKYMQNWWGSANVTNIFVHYWTCLMVNITVMSKTVFFFNQDLYQDFWKISLDNETVIETFRIPVLILRLVLILFVFQTLNQDWHQDLQKVNFLLKTLIETFKLYFLEWDWYWDLEN